MSFLKSNPGYWSFVCKGENIKLKKISKINFSLNRTYRVQIGRSRCSLTGPTPSGRTHVQISEKLTISRELY